MLQKSLLKNSRSSYFREYYIKHRQTFIDRSRQGSSTTKIPKRRFNLHAHRQQVEMSFQNRGNPNSTVATLYFD